jgi:predicted NUDIX family phosphoesterase
MPERVLVLPRARVPGGSDFRGVREADADALAVLREAVARHGRYLDRPVAEQDPSFKQLIPYVVVRDGPRTFLMERTDAGGDARLHGKASIGVGGHLNPVDCSTTTTIPLARFTSASCSPSRRMAGRSPCASATS